MTGSSVFTRSAEETRRAAATSPAKAVLPINWYGPILNYSGYAKVARRADWLSSPLIRGKLLESHHDGGHTGNHAGI